MLAALRQSRRLDVNDVARVLQKPVPATRALLERLLETGLVQPHGQTRGRTYTLSPSVYRSLGQETGYVRQAGFDRLQQEQMVLNLVDQKGSVARADVAELCRIESRQASRLLQRLVRTGRLVRRGRLKGSRYERS